MIEALPNLKVIQEKRLREAANELRIELASLDMREYSDQVATLVEIACIRLKRGSL